MSGWHDTELGGSSWVDVRVASSDTISAIVAVIDFHPDTWFCCSPHPPASGPEAELSFQDLDEGDVLALLARRGIEVLASRTRPLR